MRTLNIDIETFSSVDIKKSGMYKYADSPDFQVLLFAYSIGGAPTVVIDLAQGEIIPEHVVHVLFDTAVTKYAYNAAFEWYCLSNHFDVSQPIEWLSQWRCTMVHSMYLGYPGGLGAVAKALNLADDKRKMSVGNQLIKYFCVPCKPTKKNGGRTRNLPHHDPDKWGLFKDYNRQDVEAEKEINNKLVNFPMPVEEWDLWRLDLKVNFTGVGVDQELVNNAISVNEIITNELTEEAKKLTGLENPNSTAQLSGWLNSKGFTVPNLQKGTIAELLPKIQDPITKRVLGIRQELSRTSIKKYEAMRNAVCEDSRVRGLLQFYGANRTGRWAGRLVQVQNLPRNYIDTLDAARRFVLDHKNIALKFMYGNVPDTLSQLVRTAFIPSEGKTLVIADFAAIEARIIAWLAGEQWRLDVFNSHGKIYEASASQMFGVPLEKITRGNPEYELRQKGKVAELALGYGGSVGALTAMGALNMGLTEEELPDIVQRWRASNKRITDLWYKLNNAALEVVGVNRPVAVKGLIFAREVDIPNGLDFLTIQLPSKRKLYYVKPHLDKNQFGANSLHYYGMDQTTKKWVQIGTYGGKLVENCLAGDSLVLTDRGWIAIKDVLPSDLVWDGVEWVQHGGLVKNGVRKTIDLNGVRLTPDHLVLTEKGWFDASSCKGHYWEEVELPKSVKIRRLRRKKISMGIPVRLWKKVNNACNRVQQRKTKIMRMHERSASISKKSDTRNVKTSSLCSLEEYVGSLQISNSSSVAQLWGTRHISLFRMGSRLCNFLARHGINLPRGINHREDQCKRGLHPEKLSVGNIQGTGSKQTSKSQNRNSLGIHNSSRSCRKIRNRGDHTALQNKSGMPERAFVLSSGREEQVYDILNAGHRHRFTVLGEQGPFIVHNCVQAIARDCLAETLRRLDKIKCRVVMHVHDEVVVEVDSDWAQNALDIIISLMKFPVDWAPDLPLDADGFVADYYQKD